MIPGMGRVIRARRISRRDEHQAIVDEMRRALPLNQYLQVLHVAATQGKLLIHDPKTGQLVDARDISSKEQIDVNKYLIDKLMPARALERVETDQTDHDSIDPASLEHIPTNQLVEYALKPLAPPPPGNTDDD